MEKAEARTGECKGEGRGGCSVWSAGLGLRNDACTSTVQVRCDGGRGLMVSCESHETARRGEGGKREKRRIRATKG